MKMPMSDANTFIGLLYTIVVYKWGEKYVFT